MLQNQCDLNNFIIWPLANPYSNDQCLFSQNDLLELFAHSLYRSLLSKDNNNITYKIRVILLVHVFLELTRCVSVMA